MADRFEFYEVGGCVRDAFLGLQSKDIDFSVVDTSGDTDAEHSFLQLLFFLEAKGYRVFETRPQYFTIRAQFPPEHPVHALHQGSKRVTADFVLARREGPYSDGRRPDWVVPGTLEDDLARRDFTVNAIARTVEGEIIDPHDGQFDIEHKTLKCVGRAEDRIREDALRALRAVRFCITKQFHADIELQNILQASWLPDLIRTLPADRKREELEKCFSTDTVATLNMLWSFSPDFVQAVFSGGLRLKPTSER